MKILKTYNIGKNTTFDLTKLCQDLEKGTYTIKTQAVSIYGNKSPESTGLSYLVDPLNPLHLPLFTIRCKFSTAGQPSPAYTGVTWDSVNQVDSDGYIWDITKNSTDWTNLLRSETTLVEVLGANLTGVTKLDRVFGEDEQLVSVALFDTSTVTSFRNTFRNCTSLLNVPRFNTSAGTDFTQMFIYCSNLKSVPNIDLTSATTIKFLFGYCTSLEKAILSNSTTSLTVTECLFGECHSLKDVKFINMDTSKVTIMYHMFDTCSSLSSIPFFNTSSCYGFNYMFKNCSSLTELPVLDTSKATKFVSVFNGCINVRSGALSLYQQLSTQANPPAEYSDAFKNCGSNTTTGSAELAQIPEDWGGTYVPVDPYNPLGLPPFTIRCKFSSDYTPDMGTSQTLVDAGENVWDIGFEDASSLFKSNDNLLEVIGANTSSVTTMASWFYECTSLTSVPLFDTSSVTNMISMFNGCISLITVPLFDTSSCTNMGAMLRRCNYVQSGALALYQQASSQATEPSHQLTFAGCGSETVTGAAELAQIPIDWGGTME